MSDVREDLERIVEAMGGSAREGQMLMAEAVADAFESGEHVLVQAGTGTGKSLAYLVPAARRARSHGPVVIATATLALQRQLTERELPRLAQVGLDVDWAVLKGRHNYLCRMRAGSPAADQDALEFPESASAARGTLEEQAVAVFEWAARTTTGDRDDLDVEIDPRVWRAVSVTSAECVGESRCPMGAECFAALARAKASDADIVVTNHAMVAIECIESVPLLPERTAMVIDEAHELVDRITGAITRELSIPVLERLAGEVDRVADDESALRDAIDDVGRFLLQMADEEDSTQGRVLEWGSDAVLALTRLRDACHGVVTSLGGHQSSAEALDEQAAARQRVRAGVQEVHDTASALLRLAPSDVVWWSADGGRLPVLRSAPLDVSDALAETLFVQQPVALTSATLMAGGTFEPVLRSLGLPPDTSCLDVGSGFDHARQGILYVADRVPPPGRDGVAMEALDELADLIEAAGGRTLALFSSWRGVERAVEYLRVRLGPALDDGTLGPLLVHRRGESVVPIVERFAAEPASVLVGTVSLWQGIDVPGEACVLVAIDRIPFPRPDDPVMAARQQAIDAAGGSGFREVSLARASLLMAQGAGRLIRSADDRGVVAVLDPRLATAGYGPALRASLPPLWFTNDRAVVLGALQRLAASFD